MSKKLKNSIFLLIICLFLQFFNNNALQKTYAFDLKTSAESMVTIEAKTNRILYAKDENKKLPMASTTKILTAIVAIENCDDLDKKHKIPKESVGVEGSSIYLRAGEHLSIRELLYGLMLRSGNDSAVAIAIIISGSVEKFVGLMNDYCKKLELKNTNIVTVNGLHDDNHYTTAYELAKITSYALSNEIFAKIVSTKQTTISNELGKVDKRFLRNKNRFLNMVEGADGVKTGYTKKAGRCFVGSATKNNMQVICVVLNCSPMFEDCSKFVENAFSEYSMTKLFSKGELISIEHDRLKEKIPIILKEDVFYPLTKSEISKTSAKLKFKEDLKLPLNEENSIGTIEVSLENNLIFSQEIYTINIDKNAGVKDYFHKIVKAFWYGNSMRINKFLASTGLASRRKCEEFVTAGRVTVNGKVVTNLAFDVSENDKVKVDGSAVVIPTSYTYLMMHKPKGYLTTISDDRNRKTVMELLPAEFKHLKPVGRLDYNSEGLLLFTNDGDVAQNIMRPARKVVKTYSVKVEGEVSQLDANEMEKGVELLDGTKYQECVVKILEVKDRKTKLEVQITEGKNREIRKIFDKFGYNVIFLKRVSIGTIKLGGLTRGTCRLLKPAEVMFLKSL